MIKIKKTITSIFMIPTLKISKDLLKNNGFINGYLQDIDRDTQYKNAVYVLFKPDDLDRFRDFLDGEYERTKDIIEDYDYKDGFVVIVYKLNPKFKKDYDIIKTGKYSRTSQEFQKLFPKNIQIIKGDLTKKEISLQYRIFNRTEDLINFWENKIGLCFPEGSEAWYGFQKSEEILNIKKIKEYV